ncbi:T4 family baseplate hub assembly chaperone [Streptomyces sp. B21-083]|uniref:T4 family baseplate hub assembly chaperone n=1 Tax=Streptomyces sp. B21-083 TaxID=3039410 RepID=UPI002FEEF4EB
MAITSAAGLLAAWEAGLAEAPVGRALLLHRTARPDVDTGRLPQLPVGEREADLFALRRSLFGERMQVRLACSACGEDMEFELDAGELARSLGGQEGSRGAADGPGGSPTGSGEVAASGLGRSVVRVQQDGWDVVFRVPGVLDLAVAGRAADPRGALLARCLVSAAHDGAAVSATDLPVTVQRRIAEAVEAADPGADLALNVACPECGAATRAELDIASYLWTELDAWARDVLLDVHLLATAYGWSEPEILALSPLRRRYYLELCADV